MYIRATACAHAAKTGRLSAAHAVMLTLDSNRRVRLEARFALQRLAPETQLRLVALERLESEPDHVGAIGALGEVGGAADWEALAASLDTSARSARAALRAMRALDASASRELRFLYVDSPWPSVTARPRPTA